jgi:hypothetical protein
MKNQTNTKSKKTMVECLNCSEDIYVGGNPKVGNFVTCKNCDSLFEIVDLEPISIDWPYDDDDYGDDDDLYDDE